jgi:hypothetical protein
MIAIIVIIVVPPAELSFKEANAETFVFVSECLCFQRGRHNIAPRDESQGMGLFQSQGSQA